jgi:ParB-like chromosome segregation protein Spo0J
MAAFPPSVQEVAMPKVAIRDIEVDPTIQIRRGNHEATIRRYEESFEKLPPIDLFQTPDGLLVADGFHRLAAAERLGLSKVEARMHRGTREDALEFAVISNTKNADPLSPEERDDGIRRLKQLHPSWSNRTIAERMSVSESTARAVFRTDEVKREVTIAQGAVRTALSDSHFKAIGAAPKEAWAPLAKAAADRGWDRDTARLAAQNIRSEALPKEHKRDLLAGKADPLMRTSSGQLAVPAGVVGRRLSEMAANDAVLGFQRALEALAKARLFKVEAILDGADADTLNYWAKELPGDVAFLQGILDEAKGRVRLRAVDRKDA